MDNLDNLLSFIDLLTNNLGYTFLASFTGLETPKLPYASFQILSIDDDVMQEDIGKLENDMASIETIYNVNLTLQFNIEDTNYLKSMTRTKELKNFLDTRKELIEETGVKIVETNEILPIPELLEDGEYKYLTNLDVVISFDDTSKYEIESLVKIVIENEDNEIIEKEEV